ncbi:MAG: NAD(P)/FAD-dependent oxidoreductase [Polyangiaceae bacterium]
MSPVFAPATALRGRKSRYDAIVVGSGMGGSAAAAILAKQNASVLVLERNPRLGGILASYERDGFKIDVGSHLISRGERGPIGRLLRGLGLSEPTFITHRIPVRSRGMFQIAAPEHRRQLPAYALEAARKLGLSLREEASLARMLLQVFTLTEHELTQWDARTLDEFIREHTEHPGAYFLFSFLASIFFVLPPWQVSAGEAIRCLRWVIRAYRLSYVRGGMDSIIHALLRLVPEADGDIVVQTPVVGIRRRGDEWTVTTAGGDEYRAPVVIANLAPRDLLPLLDRQELPPSWVERVQHIRGSGNAHQIKFGLSRALIEEGCLIGGVSSSGLGLEDLSLKLMQDTVGAIEVGRVSDPMAIYAPVPSNYDASLAPPGAQLVVASIYGPVCLDPADPPEHWRERIVEAFASVVPGFQDALTFVEFSPVPAVGVWMGKSNRAAISNGQRPGQVGSDRLPVQTPLPGLFIAGDGAGGRGIGTELATESAIEAATAVAQYFTERRAA